MCFDRQFSNMFSLYQIRQNLFCDKQRKSLCSRLNKICRREFSNHIRWSTIFNTHFIFHFLCHIVGLVIYLYFTLYRGRFPQLVESRLVIVIVVYIEWLFSVRIHYLDNRICIAVNFFGWGKAHVEYLYGRFAQHPYPKFMLQMYNHKAWISFCPFDMIIWIVASWKNSDKHFEDCWK